MALNGRLPSSALTLVQDDDLFLKTGTGNAWRRFKAAAKERLGRTIAIAKKAGAYRTVATQIAMQRAYDSRDRAEMARWNMDPSVKVRPANGGTSNHGWGIAFDVVGSPIDGPLKSLARQFGITFPFGTSDPRHALHDGVTATSPLTKPVDRKVLAAYLNGKHLGHQTETAKTGKVAKWYVWLVQTELHRRGQYPTPPFVIDDEWGPKTRAGERWLAGKVGAL